jgi:hypothetical protein
VSFVTIPCRISQKLAEYGVWQFLCSAQGVKLEPTAIAENNKLKPYNYDT